MFSRFLRSLGLNSARSTNAEPAPPPSADQDRRANLRSTWQGLATWFAVAAVATIASGFGQKTWPAFLTFASAGLLLAAASASVGGLLGFLFGIPRSLQSDATGTSAPVPSGSTTPSPAAANGTDGQPAPTSPTTVPQLTTAAARQAAGLGVNTNLEQISDWLTKILVGVGLTNIESLGARLWNLATIAAPPLGDSKQIALFCMVSFSIWGFFAAYLLTRLFLAAAFLKADDAAANREALIRHEHAAFQLSQQGAHANAAQQYAVALGLAQTPDERRRLAEAFVYNSLYAPAPAGFIEAIRAAREYLNQPGNLPSGRIWAYLAAALGQQYSDAKLRQTSEADLLAIENEALRAIREALRLDPAMKPLLRSLWDPNDPGRAAPDENDLEVFFPREAFAALLR